MEPAVRGARIEPTIVVTRLETAFFASQDSESPNRQTALCRSKRCRRERNFWTQRREAKNPPERPLLSAETGNSKIGVKNTRRSGLFSIDDGFRSSGRLGGGGDRDRTQLSRMPCTGLPSSAFAACAGPAKSLGTLACRQ